MKNKFMKFIVLVLVIALVGGLIYLVVSKSNKGGKTKLTTEETVQFRNLEYFYKLGYGGMSDYSGIDSMYTDKTIKYEDLKPELVLTTVFDYLNKNKEKEDVELDAELYARVNYEYDLSVLEAMKGETVRKAIKNLFGVDWKDASVVNRTGTFQFSYVYDSKLDVYIRETVKEDVSNNVVLYDIIDTKKEDKLIYTDIIIGYFAYEEESYNVYANALNTQYIKNVKDLSFDYLSEEELGQLKKYRITSKLVDKNYVFDSIAPLK